MDFSQIVALKGEFEAEGLSRDSIAAEAAFAARNGLPYLVKIGGCEAKSDMRFCMMMGIGRIVALILNKTHAKESDTRRLRVQGHKQGVDEKIALSDAAKYDAVLQAVRSRKPLADLSGSLAADRGKCPHVVGAIVQGR